MKWKETEEQHHLKDEQEKGKLLWKVEGRADREVGVENNVVHLPLLFLLFNKFFFTLYWFIPTGIQIILLPSSKVTALNLLYRSCYYRLLCCPQQTTWKRCPQPVPTSPLPFFPKLSQPLTKKKKKVQFNSTSTAWKTSQNMVTIHSNPLFYLYCIPSPACPVQSSWPAPFVKSTPLLSCF